MQLLFGVETEFPAQRCLILEISVELRAQKVHHDGAGHGGVFGLHAVGLQAGSGARAPAGLHTALGIAVHVEPVGEHLLPVEVDDLVAAPDVVVHMAVDGLVVVHAAGHQHLRLVLAEEPQPLGVKQLADLSGIAAPLQLQLEQKVTLILADGVFV